GAAISVAAETMIGKLSAPDERARRMSYYALSVGLGWAAGPLTGTLLFKLHPATPFVACFGLSLLAALIAQAMIPQTESTRHQLESLTKVLKTADRAGVRRDALRLHDVVAHHSGSDIPDARC